MKNCIYFLIFSISILLSSCSVTQQTVKCNVNKIIEDDIQNFQEGYSLKIPSNWIAYKDIHCELTYSPIETLNDDFGWVIVQLNHNIDKEYYKEFRNIDEFVMNNVKIINKNFRNPRIEMSTLQHQVYGEYRVLKYNIEIFGKNIKYARIFYFYENSGFIINYFTEINEFEKYLPDFQKMVESFEIKE